MHMLTLHFSQAVQKFSPKNVSQYPPKSHTMNTTSLTLILVSMLVANATASLDISGQNWRLSNPTPLEPIIIHCVIPGTIGITMTGSNDVQGWELNVWATVGDCYLFDQEFGTRKATGEKKGNVVEYPLDLDTPVTFSNVTVMILVPNQPDTLVVAWY